MLDVTCVESAIAVLRQLDEETVVVVVAAVIGDDWWVYRIAGINIQSACPRRTSVVPRLELPQIQPPKADLSPQRLARFTLVTTPTCVTM